jgi:uncharacterized protein with HEPN domain
MDEADRTRLQDMLDAARAAKEFLQGRGRDDLERDLMLAFAVTRAIEIVGEAASNVSQSIHDANPAIPWRAVIGMRNRLIHGYFAVDYDIVWRVVSNDLDVLIHEIETILQSPQGE